MDENRWISLHSSRPGGPPVSGAICARRRRPPRCADCSHRACGRPCASCRVLPRCPRCRVRRRSVPPTAARAEFDHHELLVAERGGSSSPGASPGGQRPGRERFGRPPASQVVTQERAGRRLGHRERPHGVEGGTHRQRGPECASRSVHLAGRHLRGGLHEEGLDNRVGQHAGDRTVQQCGRTAARAAWSRRVDRATHPRMSSNSPPAPLCSASQSATARAMSGRSSASAARCSSTASAAACSAARAPPRGPSAPVASPEVPGVVIHRRTMPRQARRAGRTPDAASALLLPQGLRGDIARLGGLEPQQCAVREHPATGCRPRRPVPPARGGRGEGPSGRNGHRAEIACHLRHRTSRVQPAFPGR